MGYLFVFECYSIISNTSRHKRLFGIPLVSNITTILVFRVLVLLTPSIILSTLLQLYCRLLDTLPLFVDTSCISFINITINKQPYYIKYPYYNRLIKRHPSKLTTIFTRIFIIFYSALLQRILFTIIPIFIYRNRIYNLLHLTVSVLPLN